MQMLFSMEARGDFSAECRDAFLAFYPPKNQKAYVEGVHRAFSEHAGEVDEAIESCAQNWRRERIAKVDLAVLRLAIAEMSFLEEPTPESVAINEAVELAKRFGTEASGSFVNGVLGTYAKNRAGETASKAPAKKCARRCAKKQGDA